MDRALRWLRASRQAMVAELRQLAQTSRLLHTTTALVHQLQRERGLTNLFLGSTTDEWREALTQQTAATDREREGFTAELDAIDSGMTTPGLQRARLLTDIALVHQGLQALPWLREQVLERRCSARWATQAYIRLIQTLLSMVFEAADAAQDPDISRCLVALFHLAQGKELAGQERAAGALAFARGSISADEQRHLQHLIDAQQRSIEVVATLTSKELADALANLPDATVLAKLERFRRHLLSSGTAARLNSSCSAAWFAACTARLDALRRVEEQLVQELRALSEHKLRQAERSLSELATGDLDLRSDEDAWKDAAAFFAAEDEAARSAAPAPSWPHGSSACVLEVIEAQSRQLQQVTAELERVRANLQERRLIERAKGLLMARQGLSEADAHRRLRQQAMNQGRRLVDVAQALLASAELLPADRP